MCPWYNKAGHSPSFRSTSRIAAACISDATCRCDTARSRRSYPCVGNRCTRRSVSASSSSAIGNTDLLLRLVSLRNVLMSFVLLFCKYINVGEVNLLALRAC